MRKVNYHTHTYRCHHALGNEEEYVQKAIEAALKNWALPTIRHGIMPMVMFRVCE